jgi:formate dehydrogenase subunit delta
MTHAPGGKPETLIKMVNQIGSFFETMPDRQQARADIAKHIKQFWALRMRLSLYQHFDQHEAAETSADLTAIVQETLRSHREAIL